ncbi:MAG: RNA ligase family protein [Gammaproteobacteria bacterium]|nr:RNA ligase family protein [Gammaproteobacteria bacterium]
MNAALRPALHVWKYPRTPYWPDSPTKARDGDTLTDPERFVGRAVVVTEKLDGSNTLLHRGAVYARSVSAPAATKWLGMVRKHHAWKVTEPDVFLYGEDIYGVHSIEYDPVPEDRTFYSFALRLEDGSFGSFHEVTEYATTRTIPVVPVLFEGTFDSVRQVRDFVSEAHAQPSALGGEREGVVLRIAAGFPAADFPRNVCKSVRVGHVQSDEHWSKRWRPCRIARP